MHEYGKLCVRQPEQHFHGYQRVFQRDSYGDHCIKKDRNLPDAKQEQYDKGQPLCGSWPFPEFKKKDYFLFATFRFVAFFATRFTVLRLATFFTVLFTTFLAARFTVFLFVAAFFFAAFFLSPNMIIHLPLYFFISQIVSVKRILYSVKSN